MKNLTALLLALLVAGPLAAQSIIPRERPATGDREGTFTGDPFRKVMDQFAACVLDMRRKRVMQALALPADSPEQNKLFSGLSKTQCTYNTQIHFSGPTFRGSLYKALVRKDLGRKDVFTAAEPGAQTTPAANKGTFLDETDPLKFASCVVHLDPEHARDAILSTAGSDMEEEAMTALSKVYGQCLYKGEILHLSKGGIIGLLAEAYYRDATASAEVASAK